MATNAKTQTPTQMVILTGRRIALIMPTFSNRNGTILARCGSSSGVSCGMAAFFLQRVAACGRSSSTAARVWALVLWHLFCSYPRIKCRGGALAGGLQFTGVSCVSLDVVSGATVCARRPIIELNSKLGSESSLWWQGIERN